MQKPANVFERVRYALQEVRLALVEAAKSVCAQGLHDANVNVGVVVLEERGTIERDISGKDVQVVIEQLLPQLGRNVGFSVVKQGGHVVLQGSFAASLIIHEIRFAIAQHYVARLKIAIKKIVMRRGEQEFGQPAKVVFEGLFIKGNSREPEEVVLEIIEIPGNRLAIEAGARVANLVIQIATGFHLKPRQHGQRFAIGVDHGGRDFALIAVGRQVIEERRIAQIFFEIRAPIYGFSVNLWYR